MIISADEHLVEPAEFWEGWLIDGLPAAERGLAPRIEGGALVVDGQAMPVFLLFPELIAYSDAQPGELILYEDSYGIIAIAISGGNAASLTEAVAGDEVRIGLVGREAGGVVN